MGDIRDTQAVLERANSLYNQKKQLMYRTEYIHTIKSDQVGAAIEALMEHINKLETRITQLEQLGKRWHYEDCNINQGGRGCDCAG